MFTLMSARIFGSYPMMYKMAVISDKEEDCTLADMQEKQAPEVEKRAALPDPMNVIEHWQKGWVERVPPAGGPAPDGPIHSIDSPFQATTLHQALSSAKAYHTDLVGLVFFNATCPVWNCMVYDVPAKFKEYNVPCVYVYIAEFHNKDGVPNGMVPQIDMPKTLEERAEVADEYGLTMLEDAFGDMEEEQMEKKDIINLYMGSMDNSLEKKYEARPWRVYVIQTSNMTIGYKSGNGPMNCIPKLRDLNDYLKARCVVKSRVSWC